MTFIYVSFENLYKCQFPSHIEFFAIISMHVVIYIYVCILYIFYLFKISDFLKTSSNYLYENSPTYYYLALFVFSSFLETYKKGNKKT